MGLETVQTLFPRATRPFIANAPMYGFVTPTLVAEVAKAGGIGFIPGGFDFSPGSAQITTLERDLESIWNLLDVQENSSEPLPIGIGFLTFHKSITDFPTTLIPILRRYRPSAVWLFAPDPGRPSTDQLIIDSIKKLSLEGINIATIVQVGTVAAAREAVLQGADILVAQGIDAGGHQYAKNASIMTLVPEIRELLWEFPDKQIGLFAAGGIMDGRGTAAALALGADGVVMGTRFLAAHESSIPSWAQEAIFNATDGGPSTVKSTIHDDIQGTSFWPKPYDGRAIIGKSYQDHVAGLSIEENTTKHGQATSAGDNSRRIIWAGTGIGLVQSPGSAGFIVKNTQAHTMTIFKDMSA